MDRSTRQKTNKKREDLNNYKPNINRHHRILHPKTAEIIFFSSAHGTFPRLDILGHKRSLSKFKMIDIIKYVPSHDIMNIGNELNNRNKCEKIQIYVT